MKINQHGATQRMKFNTYFILVRSQLFYATWLVAEVYSQHTDGTIK